MTLFSAHPARPAVSSFLPFFSLLQSVVTILFGAGLTWYATRYWKAYDTRKKALDDAAAALKARNDTADTERRTLMNESAANKAQHGDFEAEQAELHRQVRGLSEKFQALERVVEVRGERDEARHAATKETLGRIDVQLSKLLDFLMLRP